MNHHLVLRYLIVNYWGIYCVGPAMSVGSLLYIKPLCKTLSTAATADGAQLRAPRARRVRCSSRTKNLASDLRYALSACRLITTLAVKSCR